jgi:hypothetical protein
MYCTQCHTAFSWRTGRVETGQIHNPHYYEFMRGRGNLPRNPGDIPCGGFPDWNAIRSQLIKLECDRNTVGLIGNAHRMWAHVQYVMIPRYNVNAAHDNRDLRIKFILGDVTEDEFKKKIQQREKARQRKTDIRQVLEMFNAVLIDLFQTFMQDQQLTPLLDSLGALRPHVNTTFDTVSKRYSRCAVPHVTEYYDVV